jgi:non-heme chloroperoxidase
MSALERERVALPSGVTLDVTERGRGPAIVFLHGYSDSWRSFEPILPRLPDDVRAITFSQRGHGDSDRPESTYEIADFAADVVSLMDVLGITRATIVGHSMGSLVAQELAISHPERVSRLVLIGSATTLDNPAVRELEQVVSALEDPVPRAFASEFQISTIHRRVAPEFLEMVVDESMKLPARVWRAVGEGLPRFESRSRLSRIEAPTWIVWGDRDAFMSRAEQDLLRRGIRGSRWVCYEGTGHAVHWEEPQRFTDDLMAFVRARETALSATG